MIAKPNHRKQNGWKTRQQNRCTGQFVKKNCTFSLFFLKKGFCFYRKSYLKMSNESREQMEK